MAEPADPCNHALSGTFILYGGRDNTICAAKECVNTVKEFFMRGVVLGLMLLGSAIFVPPQAARAAVFDGSWSVLVVTESGTCDRGYRYSVRVADGRVAYAGDASIEIDGVVAPNGSVKVNIGRGNQSASGIGRLSAEFGAGTWRGRGPGGDCAGRWQAERH
jgi:hypothetical protein